MNRQPSSPNESSRRVDATNPSAAARGTLSVREAGRKGGQRVRELIQRGRLAEQQQRGREQRP